MSTPEGKIKNKINKLIAKYEAIYKFMPVQRGYGAKTLDYLLCVRGKFVAIEAKAPGKKPTVLQNKTMREIFIAWGDVFVVDGPDSLNRLEVFLNARCARKPQTQGGGRSTVTGTPKPIPQREAA